MKEVLDKIGHHEKLDLQLEKEWRQLDQMKHQLFLDKLTLLFHKAAATKSTELPPSSCSLVCSFSY